MHYKVVGETLILSTVVQFEFLQIRTSTFIRGREKDRAVDYTPILIEDIHNRDYICLLPYYIRSERASYNRICLNKRPKKTYINIKHVQGLADETYTRNQTKTHDGLRTIDHMTHNNLYY